MSVTIGALESALSNQSARSYAGLHLGTNSTLVIHVVEDSPTALSSIAGLVSQVLGEYPSGAVLPASAIRYVPAQLTKAELLAMGAALRRARPMLRAQGIEIVSSGPFIMDNTYRVTVYDPSAGPDHLALQPASVIHAIESLIGTVNVEVRGGLRPIPA